MRFAFLFLGAAASAALALFQNKGSIVNATNDIVDNTASDISTAIDTVKSSANSASDIVQNSVIAPIATAFGTKYDALIDSSAATYGIDPGVLYKLLYTESHFRDDIITGRTKSAVGALGIAQFMPATAREELGTVEAALNPDVAIPGAARYLAKLIRAAGSVSGGVAAYNWGIGNVLHKGLSKAPPETVAYVAGITGDTIGV